ncbi:MAG: hypothetical protein HY348_06840 [Nitrospira defluvii]|nr:hypothetical protein [Nitrospira defluvii]
MPMQRPSCLVAVVVVATHILGPAVLWAADLERGARVEAAQRLIITGTAGGDIQAQGTNSGEGLRMLRFRDRVASGELLSIGPDTIAEILIGHRALVTAQGPSTFRISQQTDGQPVISLEKGALLVAVASSVSGQGQDVMLETPNARLITDGGLIRASTEAGFKQAIPNPGIRQPQVVLASYTADDLVAAAPSSTEIFQILEGSGTVTSSQARETSVALGSGQGVHVTNGTVGTPFVSAASTVRIQPVTAVSHHAQTPALGAQHLAEQQMQQAMALQQALLGASESTSADVQGQNAAKGAVISTLNATLAGPGGGSSNVLASLFGDGNPYNQSAQAPQDRPGGGYGGNNNSGFGLPAQVGTTVNVSGGSGLLIFTKKDPVGPEWVGATPSCLPNCFNGELNDPTKVRFVPLPSVTSRFTVGGTPDTAPGKELLLIGGTPNTGHGGIAPTETLIVRGAAPIPGVTVFTNAASTSSPSSPNSPSNGLFPTDRFPAQIGLAPTPPAIAAANSTFVVETPSVFVSSAPGATGGAFVGGTLGQFSNLQNPSPNGIAVDNTGLGVSHVDGAITATGPNVVLKGGVTLDHGTNVTGGSTAATFNYFQGLPNNEDAKYSGSLLSVIGGPSQQTSLTIGDRALAVFDGSTIDSNKALLSVLDGRLIGPSSVPLFDIDAAGGAQPSVTVASAVVVRSTVALDGALLVASAPILALTNATMTTTSHFADLAGNKNEALNLQANALVGLNAAALAIQNGNLLNLNAASATINGYLFSLAGGSTLSINNGLLFSLTNGSNLTLNANAFGVFGSGTNTLTVANGLCGGAAVCGQLVNSVNSPFLLPNGGTIKVAGVTQNLVLPNGFSVFALQNQNAKPTINIGTTDALFKADATSALTINGTTVKK